MSPTPPRAHFFIATAFILMLSLIPVIAVSMPRGTAFLFSLAGLLFLIPAFSILHEKPVFPKMTTLIVGAISALALVSSFWAVDPVFSFDKCIGTVRTLFIGIVFISAIRTVQVASIRPSVWMFPAGLCVAALLTFIDMKFGNTFFRIVRDLPPGSPVTTAEYNRVGVVLVLSLFPAIALWKDSTKIGMKVILGIFIACYGPLLLITDSQSIQMALLFGLITFFIFPYAHRAAWIAAATGVFALMLAAPFIAIWTFQHLAETINAMPIIGGTGGYAGTRLEIWDYVSRYMLQHPFHGFGFEATRQITDFDSKQIYQPGLTILHPHNFAIQIWMEFGLAGILLFGTILSGFILWMQKNLTLAQQRFTLPTLVATLSIASTGYGMWQGWWIGVLFMGAGLCILAIRLQNENR